MANLNPIQALKDFTKRSSVKTPLYHGTVSSGNPVRIAGDQLPFTQFVPRSKQYAGGMQDDLGFHLGNVDQASIRSTDKMSLERHKGGQFVAGHMEGFHVNLEKPIQAVKDAGDWTDPKLVSDVLPKKYSAKTIKGIREKLIADGYDGVIYRNLHERLPEDPPRNSFIVFDPRQVKSATRNIGTYDPTNPDFTKALIPVAVAGGASSAMAESTPDSQRVSRTEAVDPIDEILNGLKEDREKSPDPTNSDFIKASPRRATVSRAPVATAQEAEPQREVDGFRLDDSIDEILFSMKTASADKTRATLPQALPKVPELPKEREMVLTSPEQANPFSRIQIYEPPTREEELRLAQNRFAGALFGTPIELGSHIIGTAVQLRETDWKDPLDVSLAAVATIPFVGASAAKAARTLRKAKIATARTLRKAKIAKNILDLSKSARLKRAKEQGYTILAYHGTKGIIMSFDPALLGKTTGARSAQKGFFFSKDKDTAQLYAELADLELNPKLFEKHQKVMDDYFEAIDIKGDYKTLIDKTQDRFLTPEAELKYLNDRHKFLLDKTLLLYTDKQMEELVNLKTGKDRPLDEFYAMWEKRENELLDEMRRINLEAENVIPVRLRLEDPLIYDFKGKDYGEKTYSQLIEDAKELGHDSVILKNTKDGGDVTDVYVVLDGFQHNIRSPEARFDPDLTPASTKEGTEKFIKPVRESLVPQRKKTDKNIKLVEAQIEALSHSQYKLDNRLAREMEELAELEDKAGDLEDDEIEQIWKEIMIDPGYHKSGEDPQILLEEASRNKAVLLAQRRDNLLETYEQRRSIIDAKMKSLTKRRNTLTTGKTMRADSPSVRTPEGKLYRSPRDQRKELTEASLKNKGEKTVDTPKGKMKLHPAHIFATVPPVAVIAGQERKDDQRLGPSR